MKLSGKGSNVMADDTPLPAWVLYYDNHVIVVNKPAGLLTQPSGTPHDNMEDRVKSWVKEVEKKPGAVFLHALHRLDKEASGIVLFAKTSKALSRLNQSLRQRMWQKTYVATVEGRLEEDTGQLDNFLVHGDHTAYVTAADDPVGKLALLDYRVIARERGCSTVEVLLHTGRYHQIRVQLAAAGHPLLGDTKYGATRPYSLGGIALHHTRLSFPHPVSQEQLTITASSPV